MNYLIEAWRWLFRPRAWRHHTVSRWKLDITGKRIRGDVMRRRRGGKWEYRKMTPSEAREWQDMKAY